MWMRTKVALAWLGLVGCAALALPAAAAGSTDPAKAAAVDDSLFHPWMFPPPQRSPSAYFSNLQDGAQVESPFVARFGLSMRGVVPAGHKVGLAGHHHLLLNQELPLDFTKPLPFTANYIHFGKGQMETVLDLPPGVYTLRLVLADQGHIPYFVYSKPLKLTVTQRKPGVAPADVVGLPRVEMLGVADGALQQPPFRLVFHASGFNIAPVAAQLPDTHYFRLVLNRPGAKPEVLSFKSGQTEAWLNPPKGAYTAQLELVRNATSPEAVVARTQPTAFTVGP
ncbi:protein of unknown function [Rhodoferax sp. OV413]|uniref:DUF4399 domain-containing protein n=1 Tax=Rhodoferax sp. OV413 TaxID=1855285 RepID=UPI000885E657|nr:DUF4399 domain-containing protein [Rhodoferax sp. OV413]SDO73614.1 protein of unknown function [Rhodoferax sp. OV413]